MSVDLETQVRLIADAAFDETTAVDPQRFVSIAPAQHHNGVTSKEHVMLKTTSGPSTSPRRTRVLLVAASIVLVIAGVVTIALLSNDSAETPAEPSVPTTDVDPPAPTTIAAVDTAALAAIGDRVMTAFGSGDPDTIDELVADDATPVSMFGVTTKEGLLDVLGYIDAAGVEFNVDQCVGSEPDQVACTLRQTTRFARTAGVLPGEATMLMKIDDGEVIAMRYLRPEGLGRAHELFSRFVRDDDPDAAFEMWWTDSSGSPWPVMTEESFELFRRYTDEYADSRL